MTIIGRRCRPLLRACAVPERKSAMTSTNTTSYGSQRWRQTTQAGQRWWGWMSNRGAVRIVRRWWPALCSRFLLPWHAWRRVGWEWRWCSWRGVTTSWCRAEMTWGRCHRRRTCPWLRKQMTRSGNRGRPRRRQMANHPSLDAPSLDDFETRFLPGDKYCVVRNHLRNY